jgi:hypothetical protein
MGFCRCAGGTEEDEEMLKNPGEFAGDGVEKRSTGSPDAVMALAELLAPASGSARPPFPDRGPSSSAKASNEMRSAAFLLGLALR